MSDLRGPQDAGEPGPPFDVRDYERTAARVESAAAELRGLVGELRAVQSGAGGLMDAVLWRALLLAVALLGLRLVFRRLESRARVRRP